MEAETETAVWSDVLERRLDDVFAIQEELTTRIVAALETEIEAAEIRRALTRMPASLDAWGAYHRGLWHMFRFTHNDNETARGFFQQALRLDPLCARAHAGLSFTHFQDAFLHRTGDRCREADRAYRFAEQSVALDERDPTTHWVLGRALWLLERQGDAVEELGLAVDLNPNFALGHYSIAFVQSQGGDAQAALNAVDLAQRLSPIDPLLFGMLGVRALAFLNLGDYAQAAVWGERRRAPAERPRPHSRHRRLLRRIGGTARRSAGLCPPDQGDDTILSVRRLPPGVPHAAAVGRRPHPPRRTCHRHSPVMHPWCETGLTGRLARSKTREARASTRSVVNGCQVSEVALYGFRSVDEDIDDLVAQQSLSKTAYLWSGSSSYVPVRSW